MGRLLGVIFMVGGAIGFTLSAAAESPGATARGGQFYDIGD